MRFALLAATAALSFAAPVEAADYIRYDFTAALSGERFNASSNAWLPESFEQNFSFIVPLDRITTSPSGYSLFEIFGANQHGASTQGGLSLSYRMLFPGDIRNFNATICAPSEVTFTAFTSNCGTLRYTYEGKSAGFRFNGTILNFAGTEIDGTAPFVGFQAGAVAVPEPTTWAMMLAGFGFVGGAMRRQKRRMLPAQSEK